MHNNLYTADLGSGGWYRNSDDRHIWARNVLERAARLAEEMMMVIDVGIEIRAPWFDDEFA